MTTHTDAMREFEKWYVPDDALGKTDRELAYWAWQAAPAAADAKYREVIEKLVEVAQSSVMGLEELVEYYENFSNHYPKADGLSPTGYFKGPCIGPAKAKLYQGRLDKIREALALAAPLLGGK